MTDAFSLRPATEGDLDRVLGIEQKVHVAPWSRDHFSQELSKPYCQFLILTDDETDTLIAGYIIFWLMFDECHILNLAVDLSYRGLGHGKLMVRKAIHLASQKRIKRVFLEVRKTNQAAIMLYQTLNFTIVRVRKNAYSDGEDAYEMEVRLESDGIRF